MKRVRLAEGLDVTAIGLGTAPLGGLFSPVSDADAEATIERAWSLGVRFFDTAPLYGFGLAERRLGHFLRQQKRDSFAISTKVGRLLRPATAAPQDGHYKATPAERPQFDFSHDGVMRSVEMIDSNPALSVKKFKGLGGEGIHTWKEEEIAQFEARHPIGTRARLAMALMLFTGSRKGDVVQMGWPQIRADMIALRQEKTDVPLLIPIHPELTRALAATPRQHLNFLTTRKGAPFTSAGFGGWFRDRCDEVGLPQCSAHGLRKACATRLADIGCSNQQIKAITGHSSDASLAPYIKRANQKRLAQQAMAMQVNDQNTNKALSSNQTPLDKTGSK